MVKVSSSTHTWINSLLALLWGVGIFLTIPFARQLERLARELVAPSFFWWLAGAILFLSLLGLLVWLLRGRAQEGSRLSFQRIAVLLGVSAVFALWLWSLRDQPELAMHLVQYGVLSVLLFRVLWPHSRSLLVYPAVVLAALNVGILDELVQWLAPERFFDFKDIWVDSGAALLVQLGIAFGIAPKAVGGSGVGRVKSLTLNLAISAALLLLLCLNLTPKNLARLGGVFPALAELERNPSIVAEYGYRHADSEFGQFYSYLSAAELVARDSRGGRKSGKLVAAGCNPTDYYQFLAKYPRHRRPLAYEVCVRLFRRNAYAQRAEQVRLPEQVEQPGQVWQAGVADPEYRQFASVALQEHEILERYYPVTYRSSGAVSPPEQVEQWRSVYDPEQVGASAVGSDLIVTFSRRQASLILLSILALLLFVRVRVGLSRADLEGR